MLNPDERGEPAISWDELCKLPDAELICQLKAGNDDALAVIVDRYQRLVFTVAVRIVKDEGEAEDVVQTVFLEIFRNVAQYEPQRGTLKMWILQYAYSRSMNRRQHLERRQFYFAAELEEEAAEAHPRFRFGGGTLFSRETARLVEQAMSALHSSQKQAIELVYFQGLTFVEAARRTGQTLSALRHHYYRGLVKLREFMGPANTPDNKRLTSDVSGAVQTEVAIAKARNAI